MATIQELKDKIKVIDNQIGELNQKKREVQEELKESMQAAFEAQHMVKTGDPIETIQGDTVFYDRFIFDAFRSIVILCHHQKKDGTASRQNRHYIWSDFK